MATLARAALVVLTLLGLLAAACDGGAGAEGDGAAVPPPTAPSEVAPRAVGEAIAGLCELRGTTDPVVAEATFLDRSHAMLHEIAAAVEGVDRGAAGELLIAKQRVEAALRRASLPPGFAEDVERLRSATSAAVRVLGLEPPACET